MLRPLCACAALRRGFRPGGARPRALMAAAAPASPGLCPLPTGRAAAARGRQAALWSRARRLCRRLRALQARQVERHVRHQLAGLARHLGRVGALPRRGGLPPALGPGLRLLAASATARLRATQGACDSDATGSSSGSGEESDGAGGAGRRRPAAASPKRRRAECQWAMERAAIICRWTWLQAQISDLEYRIRQQTDIYQRLRAAKGPVVLGGDRQPGDLMKKQGCFSSGCILPAGPSGSSSLTGMSIEEGFGKRAPLNHRVAVSADTCVAARIRPVCSYGKRKLVRAASVSRFSRKALKPLTVKCSCEWPNSCILCGCKAAVQTIDPATMTLEERVALLDSGFHPVLSLSHGNPLHVHFETLLREDGWRRLLRHELATLKVSRFGKEQDPANSAFPKRHASLLLASSGSLLEGRRQPEGPSSPSSPVSSPRARNYGSLHHAPSWCPETPPAPPSSRIASTGSSAAQSSERRKAECSYDIDNILIPMSVAAATRVEKPQYKEIVVPSWRRVELEELEPFDQADSEVEDTSDETYSSHHSKHEALERARWDSWAAATPHKRGSRSSGRADGRWAGQPPPAPPVTAFNCLNDPYVRCPPGLHSPETCNSLPALSAHSRAGTVLSCSEGARRLLDVPDGAVQNVQPWEPRTFPLSDPAYQGLPQHSDEDGCDRADLRAGLSGSQQGISPASVDSLPPSFTRM